MTESTKSKKARRSNELHQESKKSKNLIHLQMDFNMVYGIGSDNYYAREKILWKKAELGNDLAFNNLVILYENDTWSLAWLQKSERTSWKSSWSGKFYEKLFGVKQGIKKCRYLTSFISTYQFI